MTSAIVAICNVVIIALFAYVVFGLGHSGWWFALAAVFLMRTGYNDE